LADHLCFVTDQPRYMAELAVNIMLELRFAENGQGVRPVQNPPQRDLMESRTFAAIAALSQ